MPLPVSAGSSWARPERGRSGVGECVGHQASLKARERRCIQKVAAVQAPGRTRARKLA